MGTAEAASWAQYHPDPWPAYVPIEGTSMNNDSVHGRGALLDQQTAITLLAKIVLTEHDLSDVPDKVAKLARDSTPGADEVSITLLIGDEPRTVAATGKLAARLDQRQYDTGHGPCLDAATVGRTITIEHTATDQTYPDFARDAHRAGIRCILSVSLTAPTGSFGALNVYSTGRILRYCADPHVHGRSQLPEDTTQAAESFASYAGVTLASAAQYIRAARLAEQLRHALDSRVLIEQAKGILMQENRCSPDEAFAMLIKASNHSNRMLRGVAHAIVEATQPG